jgi:hypothetical protein
MAQTYISRGRLYSTHEFPVFIDCKFQVASADSAGLGIVPSSLKGQGVSAVYMFTSGTPANAYSPASGYIVVRLADNYSQLYNMLQSFRGPLSGSSLLVASAGLSVGQPYVITILGTTTVAAWHTLGVPPGVTPAVGVPFVAAATSAVGTGAVQVVATAASDIDHIEFVGSPDLSLGPVPVGGSPNVGGWLVLQCEKGDAVQQPADGTIIRLGFYLSQSSVLTGGI